MSAQGLGLVVIAVIAVIADLVLLRPRSKAVFWFGLALTAVALGYLATTPAPAEMIRAVLGEPAWLTFPDASDG